MLLRRPWARHRVPVYFGDDHTDFDAFSVVHGRGLAIRIGGRRGVAGEPHDLGGMPERFGGGRVAGAVHRIGEMLELARQALSITVARGSGAAIAAAQGGQQRCAQYPARALPHSIPRSGWSRATVSPTRLIMAIGCNHVETLHLGTRRQLPAS